MSKRPPMHDLNKLRNLRELFEACLEVPPEQRADTARRLCNGDPELSAEVLALLDLDHEITQAGVKSESGIDRLIRKAVPEMNLNGRRAGPFEIGECIGTGGMGNVYKARRIDGEVEQIAAIKLLRSHARTEVLVNRFSNERRLLASLNHPGICRFLDAGTLEDDQPYVLMELIEGTPLFQYCDEHKLDLKARLRLFLRILEAVSYAHSRLVVHRDIKSANVMVDALGMPKLLDFGIAKTLQPEPGENTRTRERFITPRTAAPEQLRGEPVGVACDVYQLGLLLYELLAGTAPHDFADAGAAEIERAILDRPAPSMTQRCLQVPAETAQARGLPHAAALSRALRDDLDTVVLRCLRKEPDHRYASAEELAAELRRILEHRPIHARNGERWYRVRRYVARNRLPVLLTGALGISLVVLAVGALVHAHRMIEERSRALNEFERAEFALQTLHGAIAGVDSLYLNPEDMTAERVLTNAREAMEALHDSRPDLYATMSASLGQIALDLLLTAQAREIVQRGVAAAERAGVDEQLLRKLLLLRARTLGGTNIPEQPILQRALEIDGGMERPDWMEAMARWLIWENRPAEAIVYLQRALQAVAQQPGQHRLELSIRGILGRALSFTGQHEQARALTAETTAWLPAHFQPRDHAVMMFRYNAINTLAAIGDLAAAREHADEIRRHVRLDIASSPFTGHLLSTLGRLALDEGDWQLSIEYRHRARQVFRQVLGPNSNEEMRVTLNLAGLLEAVPGAAAEAQALYLEALEIIRTIADPDAAVLLSARARLAQSVEQERGETAAFRALLGDAPASRDQIESSPLWQEIFARHLAAHGCDHPALDRTLALNCSRARALLQR